MPLLQTRGLTAFYGDFQALYGIDTTLEKGETIAIIGANGAGKSTFLKAIAGLIHGAADSVLLDGSPIGARPAADIVKLGIALVPEGRRLFPSLNVEENLLIGGYGRKAPGPWTLDRVYAMFPILKERRVSAKTFPGVIGQFKRCAHLRRIEDKLIRLNYFRRDWIAEQLRNRFPRGRLFRENKLRRMNRDTAAGDRFESLVNLLNAEKVQPVAKVILARFAQRWMR